MPFHVSHRYLVKMDISEMSFKLNVYNEGW